MRFPLSGVKDFSGSLEYNVETPTQLTENLSDSIGTQLQNFQDTGCVVEGMTMAEITEATSFVAGCRAWERNFLLKIAQELPLPVVPTAMIDAFPAVENIELLALCQGALNRICDMWFNTSNWGVCGVLRRSLLAVETISGQTSIIPLLYQMARIPLDICVSRDTVQATMEGTPPCIKPE